MEAQTLLGLKDAIEQRRAARSFRPDPIPEAILKEILTLGVRAPSSFNLQPWRFIVVREQQNKEKLKACAFDQRQVSEAPVVLICCGDRNIATPEYIESIVQMGKENGAVNDGYAKVMHEQIPALFQYRPCFETAEAWTNRHTMIAVGYITIVAKSFGIDSSPMEGFVSAQVKEAFNIPENLDICCLLALGYATDPFKQYGGRFPIEQVCYSESYGQGLNL
jgi:nitroreductase